MIDLSPGTALDLIWIKRSRQLRNGRSATSQPESEDFMWVLVIVTFAINDPPSIGFAPVIRTQEFTTEERCLAAKEWVSAQLGSEVPNMNQILKDKATMGEMRPFVGIRFSAECKPK